MADDARYGNRQPTEAGPVETTLCVGGGAIPYHLVEAMAAAAKNFDPPVRGAVGRAISTHHGNSRTDYLRVFAALLEQNQVATIPIIITTPALNVAMGYIASVVLNDRDTPSGKDVKQALAPKAKRRPSKRKQD